MSASYNFALEAQRMLGSGQAGEAVRLCENGLMVYPDYATAYAILARAYLQMNDIEAAFHSVERGLERFPTNKALMMLDDDLRPMVIYSGQQEKSSIETPEGAQQEVDEQNSSEEFSSPSQEQRNDVEVNNEEEEIINDALSNVDDDNDNWAGASEIAEEEQEERIAHHIAEEEHADAEMSNNPHIIQSDALSNVDDDNDNWAGASEIAEEEQEERIAYHIAEEEHADAEMSNNPHIIQSDALSNVDDDNDNWEHAAELAEEESEVRLLQEIIEQELASVDTLETHSLTLNNEAFTPPPVSTTDSALLAFDKIKVVDGDTIVVDKELAEKVATRHPAPQLRLIETATLSERTLRTLRSSNLRLIPGLEYTPLRIETARKSHRHIPHIPEPPPFPAIRGSRMSSPMMPPFASPVAALPDLESSLRQRFESKQDVVPSSERKLSPLEELAQRLERARIPAATAPEESEAPVQQPAQPLTTEPMMVSETMALIYEQQGALDQALKAYRQLAREKPDKAEVYEQRAQALQRKIEGGS